MKKNVGPSYTNLQKGLPSDLKHKVSDDGKKMFSGIWAMFAFSEGFQRFSVHSYL